MARAAKTCFSKNSRTWSFCQVGLGYFLGLKLSFREDEITLKFSQFDQIRPDFDDFCSTFGVD